MTESAQDLVTLMAEVDVPLEDMQVADEDGEHHDMESSNSDHLLPPPEPVSGASATPSAPGSPPLAGIGTQVSSASSHLPDISVSAPSTAKPPTFPVNPAMASPPPPPPAPPATAKAKKKKSSSASAALVGLSKDAVDKGENVGRWTAEEHRLFLQGLEQHGKGWKKIASLIKTRSVVQIRTHAQKYFQKLAKARQNGEEGDVTMEGRGGISSAASLSTIVAAHTNKRRRPATGNKRKVIQSIVGSAIRQGKKEAAAQAEAGFQCVVPPLPAVAPILAHFIVPGLSAGPSEDGNAARTVYPASGAAAVPSIAASLGIISGPALEDSIFRFLTPAPVVGLDEPQVSEIARQAGANPITLPSSDVEMSAVHDVDGDGGEISPTGVGDLNIYPSWTDAKEMPSWYAKGADVDALLDVGEALDWLADTGDLNETYRPAPLDELTAAHDLPEIDDSANTERSMKLGDSFSANNTSVATLPHVDSIVGSVVPPLPSLFDGGGSKKPDESPQLVASASDIQLKVSPSAALLQDEHLQVFENPLEEQEFVSTILETETDAIHSQ